jgi:hypothetical protein
VQNFEGNLDENWQKTHNKTWPRTNLEAQDLKTEAVRVGESLKISSHAAQRDV